MTEKTSDSTDSSEWQPRIVAFLCNWCSYAGADLVLVSGCHPGDCHYTSGNYHARRKLLAFRELMTFMGIDPRRFKISWVSAAEGAKWSSLVKEITAEVKALGPFEAYSEIRTGGTSR
jgi:F420-non-reducing hydrogenase iron-sulfur subunit